MPFTALRKFKARFGTATGLLAAVTALAVLSGCVVVPAYGPGPGPGYYRGYYAPGYYYRDNNNYYRY